MLRPSSIFLGLFLKKWAPASTNTQSLPNAGQWIGYIERILILTFVLVGSFEGVGFLLAAKSVFRFGELNKAKEIRTTEYVLIGTFASFTIAILTGIALSRIFWLQYRTSGYRTKFMGTADSRTNSIGRKCFISILTTSSRKFWIRSMTGNAASSHCRQSQTKLYSALENLLVSLKKRGGMR